MVRTAVVSTMSFQCIFLLVVSTLALGAGARGAAPLPIIDVYDIDAAYDAGVAVGERFAAQIQRAMNESSNDLNTVLVPYAATTEGARAVASLRRAAAAFDAAAVQELNGVAAGAAVPAEHVWLMALQPELDQLAAPGGRQKVQPRTHCSDLLVPVGASGAPLMAHNEDDDANYALGNTYIVRGRLAGSTASYTSIVLPGELRGYAVAFNSHGVFATVNALFPTRVNVTAVPTAFVLRDVLWAASAEEAVERATRAPSAGGFSLNVGDVGSAALYNVEVSSDGASVETIDAAAVASRHGVYAHMNQYLRLRPAGGQTPDPSSEHRLARVGQLAAALGADTMGTAAGLRDVLGDTHDPQYPLYRDGTPPDDGVVTLTTVLFDAANNSATFYRGNPKLGSVSHSFVMAESTQTSP